MIEAMMFLVGVVVGAVFVFFILEA